MLILKLVISICILILSISIVNASKVFKFDDLKKDEIIANGLNEIEEIRSKSSNDSKLNNYRRSPEIDGYRFKKLVKRIVPHNYDVKEFEYDHKFNTLFKPLIRIHKENLELENESDEKLTNLVYVLDDEKFDDSPESNKDESLLTPFSTKSAQMEYIPGKYVLNEAFDISDLNYRPNKQRFKLVNDQNFVKNKFVDEIDDERSYERLKNNELKYLSSLEDSLDSIKAELNKILHNKKSPYVVIVHDLHKRALTPRKKTLKLQSLFKKLKPSKKYGWSKGDKEKLFGKETLNREKKNVSQRLKQTNQIRSKRKKPQKPINSEKNALLFGPVGAIVSKQYDKEIIESLIEKPVISKQELRFAQPIKNRNNLPDLLKILIRTERDTKDTKDEEKTYTSDELQIGDRIKSIFVGVGHINSKQLSVEERLRQHNHLANERARQKKTKEQTNRKPRSHASTIDQNTLALLNQISKYKLNKLIGGNNDEKRADKLRTLTHVKSGEEEEIIQVMKKTLDDDEVTTKAPDNWRPNYPFWNYWTYNKQIEIDDCKGQLVQHGRVCVGAWARK